MKILIFAPYFYPHKGGVEQYCFELAKRLCKHNRVVVLTSKFRDEAEIENIAGFKVYRLTSWNLIGKTWPVAKPTKKNKGLFKKAISFQPNVIITNTRLFPQSLKGIILAKKIRIKSIHIEHGGSHPKTNNKIFSFLAYIYDQTLGRLTISLADKVITLAKPSALFAQKLGAKNIYIFHNSVDTRFFKPNPKPKNRKGDKETVRILYIGRLIKAKGVEDLISVFKKINRKDLILDIIGEGNYKNKLVEQAKNDQRIKFWGEKDYSEIKKILSQGDIFVNPSYTEGMPTSVLEAGAMGLACIATDVGGTNEIIENNKNGFLFKPHDGLNLNKFLEKIIYDKKLRDKFSQRIQKKITKKFSWDRNIKKFENLLKD